MTFERRSLRVRKVFASSLQKGSLFLAMYAVTVSLFWFETGMLEKGLIFGFIAASLKTALALGHSKIFASSEVRGQNQLCETCQL